MSKAWNMIYTLSNNQEDIKSAIKNGSFYVSTGLMMNEFSFNGSVVSINASAKDTYIRNYKYVFIGKHGQILDEQLGEHGLYSFTGNEMYVRVQVISEHGAMLWTQPIWKILHLNP